ncbi:MAG: methylenetetrahydrofolate reductase [Dehalococcoidia bacterium]
MKSPTEQTPTAVPPATATQPQTLRDKLAAGRFVVSVEVDPPHGLSPRRGLEGASLFRQVKVDCINVGDSPLARVRMSPVAMAVFLQRELGVETIVHYTTRDRNLIAIHSDLVGAHVLGVRNVLCLRGDPPALGGHTDVVAVWDVGSVQLIRILRMLNDGVDWTGKSVGQSASFFIGGSANPNTDEIKAELNLMRRKVEAGAHFFMTQVVYDPARLEGFLERAAKFKLPIIVGILPILSQRQAEFLHHQAPGITLPEEALQRLRRASEDKVAAEGLAIARDILAVARAKAAGVYIVPSFGRYEPLLELVAEAKG